MESPRDSCVLVRTLVQRRVAVEIALELKAKEPEQYETTTSILCYLLIGRENRVGDLFFAVNRLKCS